MLILNITIMKERQNYRCNNYLS